MQTLSCITGMPHFWRLMRCNKANSGHPGLAHGRRSRWAYAPGTKVPQRTHRENREMVQRDASCSQPPRMHVALIPSANLDRLQRASASKTLKQLPAVGLQDATAHPNTSNPGR